MFDSRIQWGRLRASVKRSIDHSAGESVPGILRTSVGAWEVLRPPRGCVMCGDGRRIAPSGPYVLPLPAARPYQAIEIHTLRFGWCDWMSETIPSQDDWIARHSLDLKISSTWDPSYPVPKFCEVDMLKLFLAGDAEWMLYMDADIVVHQRTPRPHFDHSGFYIRPDRYQFSPQRRAGWARWCEERFGNQPARDWLYSNAGVWACDRESAARLLEVIEKPYHSGIMEQHHFNWWLQLAAARGMTVRTLPHEWNRIPEEASSPAWFFHIYAKNKFANLGKFRTAGTLPDAVKRLDAPPALVDIGARAIVWPWKPGDERELRASVASVERHWKEGGWRRVILSSRRPDWWSGEFIFAPSYEEALWLGTQCADRVLWMNDDIFLLADQDSSTFARASHLGDKSHLLGNYITAGNTWRRGLGQVLMRLHHMGRTVLDFSTHTPYLYEREKVAEVFDRFGCFWKMPFETAYHNYHRTPHIPLTGKTGPSPAPPPGKIWMNVQEGRAMPQFLLG